MWEIPQSGIPTAKASTSLLHPGGKIVHPLRRSCGAPFSPFFCTSTASCTSISGNECHITGSRTRQLYTPLTSSLRASDIFDIQQNIRICSLPLPCSTTIHQQLAVYIVYHLLLPSLNHVTRFSFIYQNIFFSENSSTTPFPTMRLRSRFLFAL